MADGTVQHLNFKLHGPGFTDLVRQRVLEGRFDWSWSALMDGLHGMTADIALRILKGDAKVAGEDPDLHLEDDDDAEYKRQLEYFFGGAWVTPDGRIMEPYAVVTSWGPEDFYNKVRATPGSDYVEGKSNGVRRYATVEDTIKGEAINVSSRSLFYADSDRDVLKVIFVKDFVANYGSPLIGKHDGVHVLWRDLKGFPQVLMQATPNVNEAFARWRKAGHRMEERGYRVTWPKEVYQYREDNTSPALTPKFFMDYQRTAIENPLVEREVGKSEKAGLRPDRKAISDAVNKVIERTREIAGDGEDRVARLNAFVQQQRELDDLMKSIPSFEEEIKKQAGDNWLELVVDGLAIRIPRAPFENWSLWRTDGAHLALPWKPVCPQGLKMMGDDVYHTDWIVGAGLPLDWMADHDGPQSKAAWDLRHKIQAEKMNFRIGVLCGAGEATGEVVHLKPGDRLEKGQIGVIPNAGPDYVQAAYDAIEHGGALITEKGGAMAHLATVGRERNLRLVRLENARKVLREQSGRRATVTVDASKGTIHLWDGPSKFLI